MGRIGGGELLLILLIALLIFGPSKLADMGKGLGEGLKNFKKGISHGGDEPEGDPKAAAPAPVQAEPPKALAAASPSGESAGSVGEPAVVTPSKPGDS